jgi:hypothetical protein
MELRKLPKQGEIYRHYKSTGSQHHTYQVIGIAKHSETEELMVVYKPIVRSSWMLNTPADFAVRPLDMFLEIVDKPEFNYVGPRFRLVTASVENSESQKITLDTYSRNIQKYVELTKSINDNPDA